MGSETVVLPGRCVRLEPLDHRHVDGLVAAAAADSSLYEWSPIPRDKREAIGYIDTALAWRDEGSAVPFATIRGEDGAVIGSRVSLTWSDGRGLRATLDTAVMPPMHVRSATRG
jgi:hypothetical protein